MKILIVSILAIIIISSVIVKFNEAKLPTDKTFLFEKDNYTVLLSSKAETSIKAKVFWSICNQDLFKNNFSEFNENKVKEKIYWPLYLQLRIKASINDTSKEIISYTDVIEKEVQKEVKNIGVCINGLKIIPT